MSFTRIQDIIDPEVLADQVSAKYPDFLVLGGTNLVEVDTTFPLGSPGTKFKIPFWKRIGAFGGISEGVAMTPTNITTDSEYAVVLRAGGAYEVYDTAELVSKADPVGEIASQIGRRAAEYIDAALVTQMEKTPNTHDGTGATLDQDVLITALVSKLGDGYMKMIGSGAMIMHSKVYGDLLKTGDIQNQYQSGMDVLRTGLIPTLLGLPIIVSDRCSVSHSGQTHNYQTYIVGPGSLALFYQRNVKVEFDRDILLQADVIAATVHFAPHLFGYDEYSDAVVAEDNKSITVVAVNSQ